MNLKLIVIVVLSTETMKNVNRVQPDVPRFIQLLVSQIDCSNQYNQRKFSSTLVPNCTQALPHTSTKRSVALIFLAKARRLESF